MSDKPEHENPEGWIEGLPAPDKDDAGWEASAEATMKAAVSAKASLPSDELVDAALLDAPKLDAEPGEPSAPGVEAAPMSGPASGPVSGVPSSRLSGPQSGGRGSLKDLAQRTAARTPLPGVAEPAPPSKPSDPAASLTSMAASSPASARAAAERPAVRRATEAEDDDSGFVDLKAVHTAATPEQAARADKTELGSADLLDDEMASVPPGPASSEVLSSGHVDFGAAAAAAAASSAAAAGPSSVGPASRPANDAGPASAGAAPASVAAKAPSSGSNSNTWIGLGIGVMGIAAAVALWITMGNKSPADEPVAHSTQVEAPAEGAPGDQEAQSDPGPEAPDEEKSGGVAISELDDATDDGEGGAAAAPTGGALALGSGKTPDAPEGKTTEDDPPASGDKGDLGDEMAKAAGDDDDDDDGEEPVPAASNPRDKSQSIPEAPPQGKVQAAIGSVLGGARACVAGGDEVSRATITFGSSGAVKSVSVSGWAAGKGAAGCIKSALKAANVGRFARPSYTIGVTVRP